MGLRARLARRWGADLIHQAELAGWPVRGRVIVNLKGQGHSLRGVLWNVADRYLILRQAELLAAGDSKPIDGEVLVERDEVEFVQVLKR